jgi:pimeloyl-ACP methyl ester carboxylesterase
MADDVAALLPVLGVAERVIVGGLSMGGYVALAFARRHAGWLAALMLADTRAEADTPEGRANRDRMIAFAEAHSALDVLEEMLPKLVGQDTHQQRPQVLDEIRQIAGEQQPTALRAALQSLRDRPDARPTLGAIAVPSLVLVGADDMLTPPAAAETLAAGISGAIMVEIPRAGHFSNLEQPEEFNMAVGGFIRRLA